MNAVDYIYSRVTFKTVGIVFLSSDVIMYCLDSGSVVDLKNSYFRCVYFLTPLCWGVKKKKHLVGYGEGCRRECWGDEVT